ncbi:MAG: cell division protein ZapA [Bacteroidota bacterium]|jgi:cell division protein ZapA
MDQLTITVRIAERDFKLTVDRNEEEIVRNAVKLIEKRITDYAKNYAFKDKQDLLSMIALQYTIEAIKMEGKQAFIQNDLLPKLNEINSLID